MSEGIDAYIKKKFEVPDVDIRTYSPLTLAYIGDGVFDQVSGRLLWAREIPVPTSCITGRVRL